LALRYERKPNKLFLIVWWQIKFFGGMLIMADPKESVSQNRPKTQVKSNIQKKATVQKKPAIQNKPASQKQSVSSNKPIPKKKTAEEKRMEEQLRSAKANTSGLRFELDAANYFRTQGWNPQRQAKILGFEYDLFDEQKDSWQAKYLLVECKNKGIVTAEDLIHFVYKVTLFYDNLPNSYSKPAIFAYMCYTGEIDEETKIVVQRYMPVIKLLKFN
jgi:hypothetical protein